MQCYYYIMKTNSYIPYKARVRFFHLNSLSQQLLSTAPTGEQTYKIVGFDDIQMSFSSLYLMFLRSTSNWRFRIPFSSHCSVQRTFANNTEVMYFNNKPCLELDPYFLLDYMNIISQSIILSFTKFFSSIKKIDHRKSFHISYTWCSTCDF